MPKTRIPAKQHGAKNVSNRIKYKIRGRKNTVSALNMTDDELVAAYANNDFSRAKGKIANVLRRRGFGIASLAA